MDDTERRELLAVLARIGHRLSSELSRLRQSWTPPHLTEPRRQQLRDELNAVATIRQYLEDRK